MLSTAFASAFDGRNRINDAVDMAALKDLLRKVRKIVECFHKSAEGATLLGEILAATIEDNGLNSFSKLAQAIHQLWESLVKSVINFIERFDYLRAAFRSVVNSGILRLLTERLWLKLYPYCLQLQTSSYSPSLTGEL
jgi:hypothetical protein